MGFASCLRYSSNVTHRRPTKLCTMFGRLLCCYAIYTFSGALAPWQNFARFKIHFTSKSCVLLYWQRYCTALQQWASAKLCGVVQGRHLYSAGRPSRWALAHIVVTLWFLWWLVRHNHSVLLRITLRSSFALIIYVSVCLQMCLNAVMGLLLWPCLSYHNVLNQFRHNINLLVSYFEQKLSIKRRQRSKGLLSCWLLIVTLLVCYSRSW